MPSISCLFYLRFCLLGKPHPCFFCVSTRIPAHASEIADPLGHDTNWEMDELILQRVLGDNGGTYFKQAWIRAAMPDDPYSEGAIDVAIAGSQSLLAGNGVKWSGQALKSELSAAEGFLLRIKGKDKMMTMMNLTPWLLEVSKLLEVFCHVEQEAEPVAKKESTEGSEEGTTSEDKYVHGKKTLALQYGHWQKPKNKPSLQDLEVFAVWQHLLTDEQASQVAKWRDGLLKGVPKPAMPAAKSSGTEKQQKKKKQQSDADLQAAALAFLKKGGKSK
eukprot:736325-Amphidinium_carterae.2